MASPAAACPDDSVTIINRIITQPHTASVQAPVTPRPLEKFYKGEPLALGYIISGSLSVVAAKNPKIPLVKGSLGMNIISVVLSGFALVIYLASLMNVWFKIRYFCGIQPENCVTFKIIMACIVVLLLFTLLEFCVAVSTVAFGCKTLCRDSYSEVSVVIYQNTVPPDDPMAATNSHADTVANASPTLKDLATP